MAEDKRMHVQCGECDTHFATEDTFPMDARKLSRVVRKTKCPECGAGSKKLYLRPTPKDAVQPVANTRDIC